MRCGAVACLDLLDITHVTRMLDTDNHKGTASSGLHFGPKTGGKGTSARNLAHLAADDSSPHLLQEKGEADESLGHRVKQGLARRWWKWADPVDGEQSHESSQHQSPRPRPGARQALGEVIAAPASRTAGTIDRAMRDAEQKDDLAQAHTNLREIQWENVLEVYMACYGRTYYLRAATDDECLEWVGAIHLAVAKANAEYNEKMGLNRGVTERVRERVRDGFDHPRTEMCVALLLVTNFVVSITQSELGIHEVQIDDDVSRYVQVYRSFCITCSTGHQRWM